MAAIHVHEADRFGNCPDPGDDRRRPRPRPRGEALILTCERLVPDDEIRREPDRTAIPFFCVDAVCEVPYGSYPGNMPYEYYSDEDHLRAWLAAERDAASHAAFLDRHVLGVATFDEYLSICGGLERMRGSAPRNSCSTGTEGGATG